MNETEIPRFNTAVEGVPSLNADFAVHCLTLLFHKISAQRNRLTLGCPLEVARPTSLLNANMLKQR